MELLAKQTICKGGGEYRGGIDRLGVNTKATLPFELYRMIVEQVDSRKDLYNLLFISRFFHVEAERMLYRTLIFSYLESARPDFRRLSRFLDQPLCYQIALHVQDLSIVDIPIHPVTLHLLQEALQQMRNLKKLIVVAGAGQDYPVLSFAGCHFQLHTLVLDRVMTHDSAFLEAQKELIELDILDSLLLSISSVAFPKLLLLAASFLNWANFVEHRPLRALCFRLLFFPSSGIGQKSVRSLRLPYYGPSGDFSTMLKGFPSLRYLCIVSRRLWVNFFRVLFTLLTHHESLEKLHFCTYYRIPSEARDTVAGIGFGLLRNVQVLVIEEKTRSSPSLTEWVRSANGWISREHVLNNESDTEWKDCRWS